MTDALHRDLGSAGHPLREQDGLSSVAPLGSANRDQEAR